MIMGLQSPLTDVVDVADAVVAINEIVDGDVLGHTVADDIVAFDVASDEVVAATRNYCFCCSWLDC